MKMRFQNTKMVSKLMLDSASTESIIKEVCWNQFKELTAHINDIDVNWDRLYVEMFVLDDVPMTVEEEQS